MNHEEAGVRRIVLSLSDREDGGLHIHSRDVPGLHLSGKDPLRVWSYVGPGIKTLLLANKGIHVSHVYLPEEELALYGQSPRELTATARSAVVMVELEPR